jgi:uncharacterized protein (TIGR02996 family)
VTEELFAAIYADPDDDSPRHVLADYLSDRGDPRGEFISLQLARGRSDVRLARELELLQAHVTEWLGPLAPVIDARRTRFERGFMASVAIARNTKKLLRRLAGERGWATVELFITGVPPQLLDRANFSALREIWVHAGEFRRLARRGDALPSVEHLVLYDSVDRGDLARVFPSLRSARLRFEPSREDLATLAAIGVRDLAIDGVAFLGSEPIDYSEFVESICASRSPFERVGVGELDLRRADDGILRPHRRK